MSGSNMGRRNGTAARRGAVPLWAVIVGLMVLGLALLAFWPEHEPERIADAPSESEAGRAASAAEPAQLYTCGMHPQVLSDTPGTCPICRMELTPVKVEARSPVASTARVERKIKYWRAPMDPNFISDRPGKSPMGMDLVPVYEDEAPAEGDMAITISPVVVQNMGVRTARVEERPIVRTVRTVGSIDYDEERVREVTTKFEGWIEELYADYIGQQIETGMPLFRVYSPEIYSSQEEYLLALRNQDVVKSEVLPQAAEDMRELARSARLRLELFDISDDQIDELERRGTPAKTMVIRSPHTGIVVEKTAREGMQVRPGMKLYTIADLSRVWVYVEIYESEVAFVKLGQNATMQLSYLPGQTFTGKVIYVYPFVDTDTRTVKVRLEFDNPHLLLKPGMFADVQIRADLGRTGLQVPRSAVIDTGRRSVAFVSLGEGRFEPRSVQTGVDLGEDRIEVLSGLHRGELVVVSGQFLLDSESKLREAILKMIEDKRSGTAVAGASRSSGPAEVPNAHDELAPSAAKAPAGAAADLAGAAEPVFGAYLDLQDVLARDDHAGLESAVEALAAPIDALRTRASGMGPSHAAVRELSELAAEMIARMRSRSLDAVRAQFGDLSERMTELLSLVGPDNVNVRMYAFHCPMAGGGWMQRAPEPRNPYYGFSMNQCGDPVDLPERQ